MNTNVNLLAPIGALDLGGTGSLLLVTALIEGEWETHLVIGHENSPLHRKTRFQL